MTLSGLSSRTSGFDKGGGLGNYPPKRTKGLEVIDPLLQVKVIYCKVIEVVLFYFS